jgi:hypothetical protein
MTMTIAYSADYSLISATKGQVPDIYGQLHSQETPELIQQKVLQMASEIDKMEKQNWQQAQERCPNLLTDEFKLMFLRCEVFNSNVSVLVPCVVVVSILCMNTLDRWFPSSYLILILSLQMR